MNNGTQNYVLTKKQLYILLVGCGGESVRGLKIDGDVPDKAEIIKTIGELSDRGYVVSDGNNFHTVGDIDKIIKLIMFAPDFYIIKGRNNVPDLCCYGDKKQFAVCEVMVTKADSIRISVCDFESFFSKRPRSGRRPCSRCSRSPPRAGGTCVPAFPLSIHFS